MEDMNLNEKNLEETWFDQNKVMKQDVVSTLLISTSTCDL